MQSFLEVRIIGLTVAEAEEVCFEAGVGDIHVVSVTRFDRCR